MHYFFFTPSLRRLLQRIFALGLCCSALLSAQAASNDVDEEGRLIAAPDETDLVERGYLFYPQRVLPKNPRDKRSQAAPTGNAQPVAGKAGPAPAVEQVATTQAEQGEHGAAHTTSGKPDDAQDSHAVTSQTLPPVVVKSTDPHAKASDKPVAGSVIVQPLERVKAVKLPDQASNPQASDKSGHAADEDTQPVMSKAEQAKLERAKAAQARAEKMKEEQAKAELARAERLKEAQAKAELARAERAKAAQARAEKLKEEQAKAELARAERAKASAQARALKAQEDLVRAEKLFEELSKADKAKAEAPKAEQAKEEPGKDEHAKDDHAKPEPTKAEPAKAEAAKPEPVKDEHATPEPTKAEPAKAEAAKPEPAKDAHAKDEHAKPEPAKADVAKDPHATPSPATAAAGQKLLLTTPESRLLTAAE